MTHEQFIESLRQTIEDRKLSRTERRAISEVLGDLNLSPSQLGAFRSAAFDVAREAATNALSSTETLSWLEDVVRVLTPIDTNTSQRSQAHFSPGRQCRERICSLFLHARLSADVCVFTITDDRITEAIVAAHQRGVRVRIITDDSKAFDRGSDIDVLEHSGIDVRVDRTKHHMHHKFAIFDGQTLLSGSYNWTVSAMRYNEENLIVTDDSALVHQFAAVFGSLWDRFA